MSEPLNVWLPPSFQVPVPSLTTDTGPRLEPPLETSSISFVQVLVPSSVNVAGWGVKLETPAKRMGFRAFVRKTPFVLSTSGRVPQK